MELENCRHIIISRTDNLGDVVLSLPVAGFLKHNYPAIKISFLGKSYTRPIIEACKYVDNFLDREEVIKSGMPTADAIVFLYPDKQMAKAAYNASITLRIGTSNRWYHWVFANKKVFFSRKKSDLHEAQLNFKLLEGLGVIQLPTLSEIVGLYGLEARKPKFPMLHSHGGKNIILHPKSKGSAREWPMLQYEQLAEILVAKNIHVWVTGTEAEGHLIKQQTPALFDNEKVHDLTGKLNLQELISFIAQSDGLAACSTGPLHISAALGKVTIGLYPPRRPIHPGRWGAVGKNVKVLVIDKNCAGCEAIGCSCIEAISVAQVMSALEEGGVLSKE